MSCESYENLVALLKETGEYVTQVHGVSMYPMLRYRKDPVLIHRAEKELKPYDIAVYDRGDNYVVHRVLEVRNDIYVIRGDNCIGKEYVPKEAVVGIVAGFWRFGKYISVENKTYQFYAHFWVAINPLVRLTHKTKWTIKKVLKKGKAYVKSYKNSGGGK